MNIKLHHFLTLSIYLSTILFHIIPAEVAKVPGVAKGDAEDPDVEICYKDKSLGRYEGNYWYCVDADYQRCCDEGFCCEPEFSEIVKQQLSIWAPVLIMIVLAAMGYLFFFTDAGTECKPARLRTFFVGGHRREIVQKPSKKQEKMRKKARKKVLKEQKEKLRKDQFDKVAMETTVGSSHGNNSRQSQPQPNSRERSESGATTKLKLGKAANNPPDKEDHYSRSNSTSSSMTTSSSSYQAEPTRENTRIALGGNLSNSGGGKTPAPTTAD